MEQQCKTFGKEQYSSVEKSYGDQNVEKYSIKQLLGNHKLLTVRLMHGLMWHEPYYPGIVFLCISFVFVVIYVLGLNVVTLLALSISAFLFCQMIAEVCTSKHFFHIEERKDLTEEFDLACEYIEKTIEILWQSLNDLHDLKQTNPGWFYFTTIGTGLSVAFLGTIFPTIIFAYFAMLIFCALPGLLYKGYLESKEKDC